MSKWKGLHFISEEKSEGCEEVDEQEDEDTENIDVGFMDNIKTAGGALLLLCLFLRNPSKSH